MKVPQPLVITSTLKQQRKMTPKEGEKGQWMFPAFFFPAACLFGLFMEIKTYTYILRN